jgi:GTP-binding protein
MGPDRGRGELGIFRREPELPPEGVMPLEPVASLVSAGCLPFEHRFDRSLTPVGQMAHPPAGDDWAGVSLKPSNNLQRGCMPAGGSRNLVVALGCGAARRSGDTSVTGPGPQPWLRRPTRFPAVTTACNQVFNLVAVVEPYASPAMAVQQQELLGTVAIVGFPNVGKSTLVNRLTGTRAAVVHETPGGTRDRKELVCEWRNERFLLIDTGGVDIEGEDAITKSIADQAREAVEEADLVLFIADAKIGITPGDEEVAQILRESKKAVLVIANKIDDPKQETLALELHRLGLGDPIPISGLHGRGTGDLLDEIVDYLEAHESKGRAELPEEAIRVAILGRPNVGKSSLVNKLLGQERVIVSEIPGTTRDAIDTVLVRGDRSFVLVDTAGLRRKRRHRQGIEYYSELRALEAAERADVALVLIDAAEGIVDQDLAVADIARKADCATLIVLSKWDITSVDLEDVRRQLQRRLRQRPDFIAISAKSGRGLERLLDHVEVLFER